MLDKILLQIVKNTMLSHFAEASLVDKKTLLHERPFLAEEGATFVTLHERGMLRGCIGSIVAHRSLLDDIISNAHAAAFRDPRFAPLELHELSGLKIEVSLLSKAKLIEYSDYEDLLKKVVPTKDGLILKHGRYQGTFLPQVWESLASAELFLEQLSYKAGATPAIYKEHPEIYRYRVEAIEEEYDAILQL